MGQFHSPPDLIQIIGDLKRRVQDLANSQTMPSYYETQVFDSNNKPTRILKPPANTITRGALIWVVDTGKVQVSDGTNWLSLN